MPSSSNNSLHASICKKLRRNLCLFLGVCGISIGLFTFCLYQTKIRFSEEADQGKILDGSTTLSEENVVKKLVGAPQSNQRKNESSVLSKSEPPPEQVFAEFNQWVAKFIKLKKSEHAKGKGHFFDPRKTREFFKKGESLSRTRAREMEKLIAEDPELALQKALPKQILEILPSKIRENMESWQEGQGDLLTHFGCNRGDHAKCLEVNHLVLDSERLEAHLYGRRKDIGSLKGAAFYGVRKGKKIAIADKPFRDLPSKPSSLSGLSLGGQEVSFKSEAEKDLFVEMVEIAERRARSTMTTVRYPGFAGSNGVTIFLERRYEVVAAPATWAAAHADATAKNGRLVCIGSAAENAYVQQLLSSTNFAASSRVWLGLTDNPLQAGTILNKETNNTEAITINASNGDWKWLSGDDVSAGYSNWENSTEPNATDFSYASLQADTGSWAEHNESLTLPYIIEYDNGFEPETNIAPIDGFRKVLVIPVRFRDEGHIYKNANFPLVDNLGNPLYPELQQDSFEPISQEELAKTMEEVRQFYIRNSDGTLNLQPVITPTITIDYDKYDQSRQINFDSLQFDATNQLIGSFEIPYSNTLGDHGEDAVHKAGQASRHWDFYGPAFSGVVGIDINSTNGLIAGNFTSVPEVTFLGGNIEPSTNLPDPDFKPAKAEAILNARGEVSRLKILDSGSFYHSAPQILLDGEIQANANVIIGRVAVSWVIVSTLSAEATGGAIGLGWLGAQGSWAKAPMPNPWYPDIDPGNDELGVTIAHELGHNFSLRHANLYVSRSEKPNSDEGVTLAYQSPYSIMGNRAPLSSGDLTVPSKAMVKSLNGFGLSVGTSVGSDVGKVFTNTDLQDNNISESNATSSTPNTFRIYRHDYGHGPYSLRTGEYHLRFPSSQGLGDWLAQQNFRQELLIGGPGDGATGLLDMTNASPRIVITDGGKGYAEEPEIKVLDDKNETLMSIDPSWIQLRSGTDESSYIQAQLRDFSEGSARGLRGLEVNASQFSPMDGSRNLPLGSYWVSYRRSASEYGLSIINGHTSFDNEVSFWGYNHFMVEHSLLDMTPNTPGNFDDCFLMLGHTFSDYESDVHITPVRKSGIPPMEYIEVVLNIGTSSSAQIPSFLVNASTQSPKVGQPVDISVDFISGNASDFAYGWYTK